MNLSFLKNNWDLTIILILYSLLAVFSLHYYQSILGDEISYVNIAHEYAIGNWADAINGYWSPFYSWLIAPFLLKGYAPIYAEYVSKTISLIIGFLTIISIRKLSQTFEIDKTVQRVMLFSAVPTILFFSLLYNTPDLLAAIILIYYLSILFDTNYPNNWINGIICGFLGATAYFTKNYLFAFFLVHFVLFNLIYYFKGLNGEKKKNTLKNMVLGLSIFFIISGLWIGTISDKYGKLTISTAGEYNLNIASPEYPTYPFYYTGLVKPPNKSAISIWDDPSATKLNSWSPFSSWGDFKYELQLIWKNILRTIQIIESFFLISFIIIISGLLFILRPRSEKVSKNKITYLLITMLIYVGGYTLIAVEWRYFFFIFILIMLMGFYLLDNFYKNRIITANMRNILLIILILSFTIEPVNEAILFSSADNSDYNLSNTLKNDYGIHGNIASNHWNRPTLSICYFLGAKYYGQPTKTNSSYNLQKELENNNIDYYFVWDKEENSNLPDSPFWNNNIKLQGYKEITDGKINGLKIYSRINKN